MRPRALSRLLAVVATTSLVVFGCAQIAGLDDPSSSSSGTSGTSSSGGEAGPLPDGIEVQPASEVLLETTKCGVESKPGAVVIVNKGKNDLSYALKSNDKLFVVRGKASGTLPPGQSVPLEVVATPTLAGEQRAPLVMTLNGVDNVYWAKVNGEGATFELSQTAVDFGDVRKENGAKTTINVSNTGGKPLTANLAGEGDFAQFTINPATISVPSRQTLPVEVSLKSGASTPSPLVAKFKPTAVGVCGAMPDLELRGKRITTDVTIDTVDWGSVGCKQAPVDRNAIIKNYGPSPVTFTAALSGGGTSAFQITGNGSATVSGGSEASPAVQQVKLKVLPSSTPGQRDENLTITYGTGSTSTGKVRAYFYGLVMAITPNTFTFSSDGGTEQRKQFALTNSGPYGGAVTIGATYKTTGAGFRAENGTTPFIPFVQNSGSVEVVFKATQAGAVNGTLTVEGTVCSQNAVTLTGNNP
ncbi:MAG: hypothetical protein JST00_27715 [Deltaproteobacteria bacterium]|nr:hypothetical protein [Deltaproteobacteria bacterium]